MPRHKATRPTTNWKHWLEYLRHYWHPTTIKHRHTKGGISGGIGKH